MNTRAEVVDGDVYADTAYLVKVSAAATGSSMSTDSVNSRHRLDCPGRSWAAKVSATLPHKFNGLQLRAPTGSPTCTALHPGRLRRQAAICAYGLFQGPSPNLGDEPALFGDRMNLVG